MSALQDILRRSAGLLSSSADPTFSVGDPALAEFLGIGRGSTSGQNVTEQTSLGLTAVWRCVTLIAGVVASLPLKSYRKLENGEREKVGSFLDDPGAPVGLTPFAWTEMVMAHLLLHGNAFLSHVHSGAGTILGLQPLHPRSVSIVVDPKTGAKTFRVALSDGRDRVFTPLDLTHVMGLTVDGIRGLSPISVARNAIGAGLAADEAAARQFRSGFLLGGVVSSDDHLDQEQARQVKDGFESKFGGSRHAGEVLVTNASLKFSPWAMTSEDAQFIESRAMQVAEVARIFGVPQEMLSAGGATSWGSGISELTRGWQKFTLTPWTSRLEEALSLLLVSPRYCEFDYAGLLQGSEAEVVQNLAAEIAAGTLTVNEARAIRNRPALDPEPTPSPPEVPAP